MGVGIKILRKKNGEEKREKKVLGLHHMQTIMNLLTSEKKLRREEY